MSYVVGLTGGIGCGKSTVALLFAELGAAVVDADAIAHELTGPRGEAMPSIVEAFGAALTQADGGLDRLAMRRLCFSDSQARKRLEAILHPMIRRETLARCKRTDGVPYVMLVVPLMIETGAYLEHIHRLLVVDCDETLQIERVMQRNGLSANEVRDIMATQSSRTERLAAAKDVIFNNGNRNELEPQVRLLHRHYVELAQARG